MHLPIDDLLNLCKINNLQIQGICHDNKFWEKRFFQDIAKYLSNRKKEEILSKGKDSLIGNLRRGNIMILFIFKNLKSGSLQRWLEISYKK